MVEDGSHDARDIVASFGSRIAYIWQENQGAAVARNTGAAAARGSWIALLDDDFWVPEKLERQFELIRAFPAIGFAHADYFWFRKGRGEPRPEQHVHSTPSGWVTQELVLNRFSIGTRLPHCSVRVLRGRHRGGARHPVSRVADQSRDSAGIREG